MSAPLDNRPSLKSAPLSERRPSLEGAPLSERRPWDEAELAARRLAGAPEIAPVIRNFVAPQIGDFFAGLPLIFVGGLDRDGAPSASILRGPPGFIGAPDPHRLDIAATFPAQEAICRDAGAPLALIGIDFAARRRNRANGRVLSSESQKFALTIEEAFGNCPKYIAPHEFGFGPPGAWGGFFAPDADVLAGIAQADFFLLATRGAKNCDISHRGGPPGFVTVKADGTLNIPDYPGNNYFNSFGNLLTDRRAALLFPDFSAGMARLLLGEAEVFWSAGERKIHFRPQRARLLRLPG